MERIVDWLEGDVWSKEFWHTDGYNPGKEEKPNAVDDAENY